MFKICTVVWAASPLEMASTRSQESSALWTVPRILSLCRPWRRHTLLTLGYWGKRNTSCKIHVWLLNVLFLYTELVNSTSNCSHFSPVHLCGEHAHHRGNSIDADDVSDGLKHIEVEERLPWHGAVQPRLHKRRPVLLQHPLWPTNIILADPGHTRIHDLRGAGVWQGRKKEGSWVNVTKNTSTCWIMHLSIS